MTKDVTPREVGLSEGLGPAPERAEWVRAWFAKRYADSGVFDDGAEALTLEAACQLVADAQAAERERCSVLTDDMLRYAMAALGTGSPAEAARFRAFWLHAMTARDTRA
jgi:hypothetical protein